MSVISVDHAVLMRNTSAFGDVAISDRVETTAGRDETGAFGSQGASAAQSDTYVLTVTWILRETCRVESHTTCAGGFAGVHSAVRSKQRGEGE